MFLVPRLDSPPFNGLHYLVVRDENGVDRVSKDGNLMFKELFQESDRYSPPGLAICMKFWLLCYMLYDGPMEMVQPNLQASWLCLLHAKRMVYSNICLTTLKGVFIMNFFSQEK